MIGYNKLALYKKACLQLYSAKCLLLTILLENPNSDNAAKVHIETQQTLFIIG